MNSMPDGLLGAIVASESLGLTDTMVNGAGGCRSRAQIMLHELLPSYERENGRCCDSKYFSRQSRLPCTHLNNDDIVFGTGRKVSEGLVSVSNVTGRSAVLVDTLGASLVCTDYSGLAGDHAPILLDGDLSSMGFSEGYDTTVESVLGATDIENGEDGSVNLLGYGIQDPGWECGSAELRRLLEAMDVHVNAVVGCRPSADEVRCMGKASLNVMVRPEYSRRTASSLERRFGTPSLRPSEGAPIGYPATRAFLRGIGDALDVDPEPALELVDAEAEAVHRVLMNFDRMPLGLHAKGFAVDGDSSSVLPLLKWMHGTFAMVPRRIQATDDAYSEEISSYLESAGFPETSDGEVDAVFCDGMTALRGKLSGGMTGYVEIGMPRGRQIDLMGRCVVGTAGCRYILDELFNSIGRFRCGQPTEVDYRPSCCLKRTPRFLRSNIGTASPAHPADSLRQNPIPECPGP